MLAFARRVFVALLLLAVAAPVWGADLQIGDFRLIGLSADAVSLVGAALLLSRAITGAADTAAALVGRLERLAPVVRVELVEPNTPPPSPSAEAQAVPTPPAPGRPLLRLIGIGAGVSGCLAGSNVDTADTADTSPPLVLAVGCQNSPREWGVSWETGEDLGWIDLGAETASATALTTVADGCGLWLTGLSCDEPVAVVGHLFQRLGDVEACAQTSSDGSAPFGASCPATFDPIFCE